MNILTYAQAHPGIALIVVGFAIIAGVLIYDNWSKLKLPGGKTTSAVIDQRTAIDYGIALQRYFAAVNCSEGLEATETALTHASHYHPLVTQATIPSQLGATVTVVGPIVQNSQPST